MCASADQPLETYLKGLSMEVSHNRMITQENKCGYGAQGVCCRLCSNGPCRISKARPRGVCGADADTIAARNFLRSVAAGSGCYIHVVENAAKQLKKTAAKKSTDKKTPAKKAAVKKTVEKKAPSKKTAAAKKTTKKRTAAKAE